MDVPQTEEHGYVSDDSDFEQIIWEFEHKDESTPLFLFNVTIQNHGSYTVEDYPAEVQLADEPGVYPKAEQYLTLANKTDEAFKKLIDYFSAQTERPFSLCSAIISRPSSRNFSIRRTVSRRTR